MNALTKVYFIPPVEFVSGLRPQKNGWSILVPRMMSPIFNQFASGVLHSVLHVTIYDSKQAYEFVCYICNFLNQKKDVKFFFNIFSFIGNGQACLYFQYIYIKCFTLCILLDEVASAERINGKFIIEVIILRQQHENI